MVKAAKAEAMVGVAVMVEGAAMGERRAVVVEANLLASSSCSDRESAKTQEVLQGCFE